jgi:hypothetical protein
VAYNLAGYSKAAQYRALLSELQLPTQLTHLSLESFDYDAIGEDLFQLEPTEASQLSQLSGLVNLRHLKLALLPSDGVPGGLPSQLTNLTCLLLTYQYGIIKHAAEQFQHIGSLTALRHLAIEGSTTAADLSQVWDQAPCTAHSPCA